VVERHHVDIDDPQSNSQVCYINEARTAVNPDDLVFGIHETSKGIQEFSINYTSSREVYDCSTTITNLCFVTIIAENFLSDPDPKTMAEHKNRSNWYNWKETIEVELDSLKKKRCSQM
jgi:hypothetical protein